MGDSTPSKSLKLNTTLGVLWGAIGGLIGKLVSFTAQLVLGWLLSKEDFGLYAIAVSCTTFVGCLNNGGTQRILVQRGKEYPRLAMIVFKISLLFNTLVAAILWAVAEPLSVYYHAPELRSLFVLMGMATVLATPGYIFHAKLLSDLRFGLGQILAVFSLLTRHGSMVVFAYLGFGPRSFVLPLLIIAVTDSVLAWLAVGSMPPRRHLSWMEAKRILKDSKWVMLGSLAAALILNGDNLAISLVSDKITLGTYFFAFQLTFSMASLLGGSLQSVLMPAFARISDDPARQRNAFLRSISAMALAATLLSFGLVIVSEPMIVWLWGGKWDEAVPVVQILSFCLPFVLVASIGRAAIEAKGGWSTITLLSMVEGIGTVLAALGGALLGGLVAISIAVVALKFAASLVQTTVAIRLLGGKGWQVLAPLFASYLAGLAALAIAYASRDYLTLQFLDSTLLNNSLTIVVYLGIFLSVVPILCRPGWHEVRMMVGDGYKQALAKK